MTNNLYINMKAILSKTSSPYINLATEEYLLKNSTDEILFLYRNDKSLIIGKHQNSNLEINVELQHKLNIPIVRRLSGGGTVFHDLGNINFCFITNEAHQRQVNFEKYAQPIQEALRKLGVEISIGKRHEFLVDGKKISGNASHIWKNRVIHHGTLLYNSDTNLLLELLKINRNKYIDKSVKSVTSEVITIKEACKLTDDVETFTQKLLSEISLILNAEISMNYLDSFEEEINAIANTKFKSWEWNYGYNPSYLFNKTLSLSNNQELKISFNVDKGIISNVNFEIDNNVPNEIRELLKEIIHGKMHSIEILSEQIDNYKESLIKYISPRKLIEELF